MHPRDGHRRSNLFKRREGKLFQELTSTLKFYTGFEINDQSGVALTPTEMDELVRVRCRPF